MSLFNPNIRSHSPCNRSTSESYRVLNRRHHGCLTGRIYPEGHPILLILRPTIPVGYFSYHRPRAHLQRQHLHLSSCSLAVQFAAYCNASLPFNPGSVPVFKFGVFKAEASDQMFMFTVPGILPINSLVLVISFGRFKKRPMYWNETIVIINSLRRRQLYNTRMKRA